MRSIHVSIAVLATTLFGATGCSAPVATHGGHPCTRPTPPAGCGDACGSTADCPAGLYCGTSSQCTADCETSTGSGCLAGQTCGPDGRCTGTPTMDGGTTPHPDSGPPPDLGTFDNTCASVTLNTSRLTPNVVLVVDRSGSMTSDFDMGLSRWETLYNALMSTPSGLVYSLQDSARFGLVTFTGQLDPFFHTGTCPDLGVVLPPALHNYDAINALYSGSMPDSNTPTGPSMDSVVTMLEGMPLEPGPTIIVLCTDGEPNTCEDSGDTTTGQALSVAAATRAAGVGYTVYAIGVATGVSLSNLMAVASAGGGTAVSVTDTTSLVTALTTIVGGAISCTLTLDGMIDPSMACGGTVDLNGTPLGCGDPNGWDALDMNHIELRGTACDTLLHTMDAMVTASFPCGVILH